jgi:hypothetical protein
MSAINVEVYAKATRSLLDSIELLRDPKETAPLERLWGMSSAVASLHEEARKSRVLACLDKDRAQSELEALIQIMATVSEEKENLVASIQNNVSSLTMVTVQGTALTDELKWVRRATEQLRREDNPFLYRSKLEDLERLMNEEAKFQHDLDWLNSEQIKLNAELEAKKAKLETLRSRLRTVEEQQNESAHRVAFLLRVDFFYGLLDQKLSTIDARIGDVQDLVSELIQARDQVDLLEVELLRFAEEADRGRSSKSSLMSLRASAPAAQERVLRLLSDRGAASNGVVIQFSIVYDATRAVVVGPDGLTIEVIQGRDASELYAAALEDDGWLMDYARNDPQVAIYLARIQGSESTGDPGSERELAVLAGDGKTRVMLDARDNRNRSRVLAHLNARARS